MRRVLLLMALAACSDRESAEVKRDPPQRRVIEPPSDDVRSLPPHAIRADGVGPYKLGLQLESLRPTQDIPRSTNFEIPGVVHASVARADDAILLGGEPRGKISFVAVVGGDVARTESGIHVGSTRDQLVQALGASLDEPDRARDPRMLAPAKFPNLRAIMTGDSVGALVVRSDLDAPHAPDPADCTRPASADGAVGSCLAGGELISIDRDSDDIAVRAASVADGDRTLAIAHVPGLVFAAPLRAGDRDELVAISRTDDAAARTWSLVAFRLEAGKLVHSVDPTTLYQVTSGNARWIGAELGNVELYLELSSRADGIEVGGLLINGGRKIRDVLAISPISVGRKRGKPVLGEGSDARVPQEAADAGSDHRTRTPP